MHWCIINAKLIKSKLAIIHIAIQGAEHNSSEFQSLVAVFTVGHDAIRQSIVMEKVMKKAYCIKVEHSFRG